MASQPFILNRDMITQSEVYMLQVDKWNSDRDTYLMHRVFLTEDSVTEYMEKLWGNEEPNFNQFSDWTGRVAAPGYNTEEFITRDPGYIRWNFEQFDEAGIISQDELSELNWELEYGLTIGYSVQILKWKPELGTYG